MKKMKIIKDVIALRFKTSESEGVILHGEGQQGDYITLELHKAKLLLQINLGAQRVHVVHVDQWMQSKVLLMLTLPPCLWWWLCIAVNFFNVLWKQ